MKLEKNKFGEKLLHHDYDLKGKTYCICTACMSIYSEFLSWANANPDKMTKDPNEADNIVVLSCQVTDLAVLNDIRTLEELMSTYPGKEYFIGGCLARRFDIPLPLNTRRLSNVYSDHQNIDDFSLVTYAKPFWAKDFVDEAPDTEDGHLFRNMYPLRIGVGCKGKCTYCTIRITRGPYKEVSGGLLEFQNNDNVVLIADSPTHQQIIEWSRHAMYLKKPISLRNVEPPVAKASASMLFNLAKRGLLKHFHCPVQHTDPAAIKMMGRKWGDVEFVLGFARALKSFGVITATNVIVDYKDFPNPDNVDLKRSFDYISWNPFWDGIWNREKAEKRFDWYTNWFTNWYIR